jgi:uncharacterized protein (DUF2249 family)/iron-sulfur cluster repair protein YtfE (RIC family)
MSHTDADHAAADAVVAHHTELTATLTRHVTQLRAAARSGNDQQWAQHRDTLSTWLRTELLPHAAAEESSLYPPAGNSEAGRLLVKGMIDEHHAIGRLVTELETAGTAVDAAGAARALAALFEVHLAKENTLVLPLLLASEDVSVAGALAGMHELLGAEAEPATGGCGCGGEHGHADAPAPVLTVDTRLDVRALPHGERHARVLAAVSELPADGALVLVAPHAPVPLLNEIEQRFPGQIDRQWLQEGPDVWQIRLHRQFVSA